MTDVAKQEIDLRVREWRGQYDDAEALLHQYNKAKEISDNTASIIMSKMRGLDLNELRLPSGHVVFKNGELSLKNHNAKAEEPAKPGAVRKKIRKKEVTADG